MTLLYYESLFSGLNLHKEAIDDQMKAYPSTANPKRWFWI